MRVVLCRGRETKAVEGAVNPGREPAPLKLGGALQISRQEQLQLCKCRLGWSQDKSCANTKAAITAALLAVQHAQRATHHLGKLTWSKGGSSLSCSDSSCLGLALGSLQAEEVKVPSLLLFFSK